jgi:hypothetical protein
MSSTLKPILIAANSVTTKSKELCDSRPIVVEASSSAELRRGRVPCSVKW